MQEQKIYIQNIQSKIVSYHGRARKPLRSSTKKSHIFCVKSIEFEQTCALKRFSIISSKNSGLKWQYSFFIILQSWMHVSSILLSFWVWWNFHLQLSIRSSANLNSWQYIFRKCLLNDGQIMILNMLQVRFMRKFSIPLFYKFWLLIVSIDFVRRLLST